MREEEMIDSSIWSAFHAPAPVLEAGDSAGNTTDKIPALMELLSGRKVENKQCMMVINTTVKNKR